MVPLFIGPSPAPPLLPPVFGASAVADPWGAALAAAGRGCEAGALFYRLDGRCRGAVVLMPDRPVADVLVLQLAGVAVREALCGVLPPQTPVSLRLGAVLVNGAEAGALRALHGGGWIVLGFDVAVDLQVAEPGLTAWRTDLREEGSEASATQVLERVSRHLLAWVDEWQEGGDTAIEAAWRTAEKGG